MTTTLTAQSERPTDGRIQADAAAPEVPEAPAATGLAWAEAPDAFVGISLAPLWDLLDKGGPVVAILIVMSLAATTVGLAKWLVFLTSGVGRARPAERALGHWQSGASADAMAAVSKANSPTAALLRHMFAGLAAGHDEARVREDAERFALSRLAGLRSHLRVLEATSQLAPLLGLFGTVIGMIGAFQTLQSAGAEADPSALAGGIWVALLTTAVGLAVAMPAALALFWFEGRIEREQRLMEDAMTRVFTGGLIGGLTGGLPIAGSSPTAAPPTTRDVPHAAE